MFGTKVSPGKRSHMSHWSSVYIDIIQPDAFIHTDDALALLIIFTVLYCM